MVAKHNLLIHKAMKFKSKQYKVQNLNNALNLAPENTLYF